MFTGLIEDIGEVLANESSTFSNRLIIKAGFDALQAGESIAVNGVCLTLVRAESGNLHFDISPETLKVTSLGSLSAGKTVNLERAMQASARFGGHYVSGHVDAIAQVLSLDPVDNCLVLNLTGFNTQSMAYLIPKGSICIEGVSLTINTVSGENINLMLIPHTLLKTTLGALQPGHLVNIEFDYLTRIVAHQLQLLGKLHCEVNS